MLRPYKKIAKIDMAFQWHTRIGTCKEGVCFDPAIGYYVITIHGQKTPIADGDYIIQEPDGIHYYPCKPDIFEANHENVSRTLKTYMKVERAFQWREIMGAVQDVVFKHSLLGYYVINGRDQKIMIEDGDYIIIELGGYHASKPEIFEANHEGFKS